MNEVTKTETGILESLRGQELTDSDGKELKYKPTAIAHYLDFLKETGLGLDTGLVPYVEDLKKNGYPSRKDPKKRKKYMPEAIIARVAAAKALGNYVVDKYPDMLTPEQYVNFEKSKKAATKACPEKVKGLDSSKYLPWAEVEKVIKGTEDLRIRLIMQCLAQSGARISELLNIELADMVRNTEYYHILVRGKGDKYRNIDVRIPIIEKCLEVFAGKKWLFEHDGKMYNSRSVTTRIGDAAEKVIGRRISAHVFRHSWTTEQQERKTPLSEISQQLGHASLSITADIYGHKQMKPETAMLDVPLGDGLDPEEDKKVAAALDKALKHVNG